MALVLGCAPRAPVRPQPPGALRWQDVYGIQVRRHQALASFQGQGSIRYEGTKKNIRSAHMVVVKAPDKVRIDFRSPFSLTYTVATDGRELSAYDRGEKVLYRGTPTIEHLRRFTHVPVPLLALTALLRGLAPLPDPASGGSLAWKEQGWVWTGRMPSGEALVVGLDRAGELVRWARLTTSAGPVEAEFDRYEDVSGEAVAHRIRARLPDGSRIEIRYGTIWRDRVHRDAAFRLQVPSGVRVVELDA